MKMAELLPLSEPIYQNMLRVKAQCGIKQTGCKIYSRCMKKCKMEAHMIKHWHKI